MTPDEKHLAEAALSRAEMMASVMRAAASRALAPTLLTDLARQADQVEEVRKELKRRNPDFDGTLTPTIEGDVVAGLEFFTGYLVEKSLSIDNVFVFLLIFNYFHVPPAYQHKVLFWGILGAIVLRVAFIVGGLALMERFRSRQENSFADRLLAALRREFGGHAVVPAQPEEGR